MVDYRLPADGEVFLDECGDLSANEHEGNPRIIMKNDEGIVVKEASCEPDTLVVDRETGDLYRTSVLSSRARSYLVVVQPDFAELGKGQKFGNVFVAEYDHGPFDSAKYERFIINEPCVLFRRKV